MNIVTLADVRRLISLRTGLKTDRRPRTQQETQHVEHGVNDSAFAARGLYEAYRRSVGCRLAPMSVRSFKRACIVRRVDLRIPLDRRSAAAAVRPCTRRRRIRRASAVRGQMRTGPSDVK